MRQTERHILKFKFAAAMAFLAATLLMAPLRAIDPNCWACGEYSGTAQQIGDCLLVNMAAICGNGTCMMTIYTCPETFPEPVVGEYCTCE
jgi:hypothetical protein